MSTVHVLTLAECVEANQKKIWLQMRHSGEPVPVWFAAEQMPWLHFQGVDPKIRIQVKGSEYGHSWRCFRFYPEDADAIPWEDGGGRWIPEG